MKRKTRNEQTSAKVGSIASAIQRAKTFYEFCYDNAGGSETKGWKLVKSVAGSDLSQVRDKDVRRKRT